MLVLKIVLLVVAALCALAVLVGESFGDLGPVKMLAVSILALAVAVVIPPNAP